MSENLFAGLDVASAEDPNYIKPNKYPAFVYDIEVGLTKAKDKTGMKIFYRIVEGHGAPAKATVMEWQHIPTPPDPKSMSDEEARSLGYLKKRLASLGIPENRMNSISRDDLIGQPVYVTIKDGDNGYSAVAKVEKRDEDEDALIEQGGFDGFN